MAKHTFGLANVLMGAIALDGGMGTSLEAIGETVADSATLTTEDDTITDFNIEEADDPVESVVSAYGKMTFAFSTYNVSARNMFRFFGGILKLFKSIASLGAVTAGSGYVDGAYTNVPLTGGTGKGAMATIVVDEGGVDSVTITDGGEGYTVADSLSAAAANIGGTGSGFAVPVATLANGTETASTWTAPATMPELEKSLKLLDRKGNAFELPRVKITAKPNFPFAKTALGQLDLIATVLLPTKAGTGKLSITYA